MTTPTGPISLGNVQNEFGGGNPISISEYYRGGVTGYVPANTAAGISGVQISTSGTIRLGDFRGVTKITSGPVSNFGGNLTARTSGGGGATSVVIFNVNGALTVSTTGTVTNDDITGDTWYSPVTAGAGNNYWARATLQSGSAPSGASGSDPLNTWVQLNVNRRWGQAFAAGGQGPINLTSIILIEIAASAGGAIVASGIITTNALRT